MGEHHSADVDAREPRGVGQTIGRGALVASAALAMSAVSTVGAGFASAAPSHDADAAEGPAASALSDTPASSATSAVGPETCATGASLPGGVLDGLGLDDRVDQLCDSVTPRPDPSQVSRAADTAGASSAVPGTARQGSRQAPQQASQQASEQAPQQAPDEAPATATNPDDIPPAPGETKVIDLPDQPAS